MKPLLRIQTPFREQFEIVVENVQPLDGKPIGVRWLVDSEEHPFSTIEDVSWYRTMLEAIGGIQNWINARQNYYKKLTKRLSLVQSVFTSTGILGNGMLLIEGNQAASRVVEQKEDQDETVG